MSNITCVIFGILFFIAGVLFGLGKIHPRLAAWKATPQEDKDKINIVPLCHNIGSVISLSGVLFFLRGIIAGLAGTPFTIIMLLWMVLAGADVYYIYKSGRYYN